MGIMLLDEPFYAPAKANALDPLFAEYQLKREKIAEIAELFAPSEMTRVVDYFIEGNKGPDGSRYGVMSAERMFKEEGAVAALNATYWQRALALTDVYQSMPQARRTEWDTMIRDQKTPDFERETVAHTMQDLLASRSRFFAERVDGIFRNLSGEHVTNSPMAFGKRMIIAHLVDRFGSTNSDRVGYINDLRAVIAKFMGRDEPRWNSSNRIVERARRERRGEWVSLDGGALRLRAYKCGTAHLEVHQDLAWRLNAVLSHLYPDAIPASARTRPAHKPRDVALLQRPLPFAVIEVLADLKPAHRKLQADGWRDRYAPIPKTLHLPHYRLDKGVLEEVKRVLISLGGVADANSADWHFDYEPSEILAEIVCSGCVPDQKAHQFYPTPSTIAERVRELAGIQPGWRVLEPSAGRGDLVEGLPLEVVQCVEVSDLHAAILRAKGYAVDCADFLAWSERHRQTFEAVLMNPPFSEGRWQAHLTAAANCVKPGGRLVAVVPASARGKPILPESWAWSWTETIGNEFDGTSVSVVILSAEAPK